MANFVPYHEPDLVAVLTLSSFICSFLPFLPHHYTPPPNLALILALSLFLAAHAVPSYTRSAYLHCIFPQISPTWPVG